MGIMSDIHCKMGYRETVRRQLWNQADVRFNGFYYESARTTAVCFVVTSEPMRGQMFEPGDIEPVWDENNGETEHHACACTGSELRALDLLDD